MPLEWRHVLKSFNKISKLWLEQPTAGKVLLNKGHQPQGLQSKCYESAPCKKVRQRQCRSRCKIKCHKNNLKENILFFSHAAHLSWRLKKSYIFLALDKMGDFQPTMLVYQAVRVGLGRESFVLFSSMKSWLVHRRFLQWLVVMNQLCSFPVNWQVVLRSEFTILIYTGSSV